MFLAMEKAVVIQVDMSMLNLDKYFEQYKNKILIIVICITTILIFIFGYILYKNSVGTDIDVILPTIIFWMASMIFLLSLNSDSKMAIFTRSLFVFLLMCLSIYLSVNTKLDIIKLEQDSEKSLVI